jgi:hypothetical protein
MTPALYQLSYLAIERDRLFIPLRDSLRPFVAGGGFEPHVLLA